MSRASKPPTEVTDDHRRRGDASVRSKPTRLATPSCTDDALNIPMRSATSEHRRSSSAVTRVGTPRVGRRSGRGLVAWAAAAIVVALAVAGIAISNDDRSRVATTAPTPTTTPPDTAPPRVIPLPPEGATPSAPVKGVFVLSLQACEGPSSLPWSGTSPFTRTVACSGTPTTIRSRVTRVLGTIHARRLGGSSSVSRPKAPSCCAPSSCPAGCSALGSRVKNYSCPPAHTARRPESATATRYTWESSRVTSSSGSPSRRRGCQPGPGRTVRCDRSCPPRTASASQGWNRGSALRRSPPPCRLASGIWSEHGTGRRTTGDRRSGSGARGWRRRTPVPSPKPSTLPRLSGPSTRGQPDPRPDHLHDSSSTSVVPPECTGGVVDELAFGPESDGSLAIVFGCTATPIPSNAQYFVRAICGPTGTPLREREVEGGENSVEGEYI